MRTTFLLGVLALAACNPLPEGNGLTLSPEAPLTDDALTAYVDGDLGDTDKVTWTYTWSVDGAVQDDLTGSSVPAERTAKGETWEVSARAVAGKKETEPLTASVRIGNTPPVGESVSVTPTEPVTTDTLTATPVGSDADDDDLGWLYRWDVNGEGVPGVTGDTLTGVYFAKGDQVRVTATPADGSADGEPVTSAAVEIGNLPPEAPTSVTLTPAEPMDHEDLLCTVLGDLTDPDDDDVTVDISWTVDGEHWAGETTTTDRDGDTVPSSATQVGQAWSCAVVASDGTDTTEPVASSSVSIRESVVEPGVVDVVVSKDGWSARCRAWDGNTCVHIQQRVDCGSCGTYDRCGEWHDTTLYNNSGGRTAHNLCLLLTGDPAFVDEGEGDLITAPAACGWSAPDHPICESGRASIRFEGSTENPDLGLLLDPGYCSSMTGLYTLTCAGW